MFEKEKHTIVLDEKFGEFINEHHVLTLATQAEGQPYCCNCFYVYDNQKNIFIVKTKLDTRHAQEMLKEKRIAGSVVLETEQVGKIQGLQFTALADFPDGEELQSAKKTYLKKFPYAALEFGEYVILNLQMLKLTDNRLGFGKKLIWDINTTNQSE